jgi:hypothetical protein
MSTHPIVVCHEHGGNERVLIRLKLRTSDQCLGLFFSFDLAARIHQEARTYLGSEDLVRVERRLGGYSDEAGHHSSAPVVCLRIVYCRALTGTSGPYSLNIGTLPDDDASSLRAVADVVHRVAVRRLGTAGNGPAWWCACALSERRPQGAREARNGVRRTRQNSKSTYSHPRPDHSHRRSDSPGRSTHPAAHQPLVSLKPSRSQTARGKRPRKPTAGTV